MKVKMSLRVKRKIDLIGQEKVTLSFFIDFIVDLILEHSNFDVFLVLDSFAMLRSTFLYTIITIGLQ